jgi:DnaJ-class molecular chaperone
MPRSCQCHQAHDFYGALGLRPGATDSEISSAFSVIENIQGADINKSVTRLAFGVLGHASSRSAYDSVHGFSAQPQGRKVARSATWSGASGSAIDGTDGQISAYVNLSRHSISDGDDVDGFVERMAAPPCLSSHRYKKKPRRDSDLYTCFGAATAGCLPLY